MKTTRPLLLFAVLLAGLAGHAPEAGADGDYALEGRVAPAAEAVMQGGVFVLSVDAPATKMPRGGEFVLLPGSCASSKALTKATGCACLCNGLIFSDGFESGNTTAWSATVP